MMKTSLHAYTSQLQTKADTPGPDQRLAKTMFQNFLDVSNKLSGRWIFSGVSQKTYVLSNQEFHASICRRNTFVNKDIPQHDRQSKPCSKKCFRYYYYRLWRWFFTPVNPSHRQLWQLWPNDNGHRSLTNRGSRVSSSPTREPLWV